MGDAMLRTHMFRCYLGVALVAGTMNMACAQDAPPPDESLGEIIVTAQRRTENVQKAALGIDVISPQTLANQGINSASDLSNSIPSIQFSNAGNGSQTLYIRGVGTYTPSSV